MEIGKVTQIRFEDPDLEKQRQEWEDSGRDAYIEQYRLVAQQTETFRAMQDILSKSEGSTNLDTGIDIIDGSGIVAKIIGKNGGEVMLFEWDNYDDDGNKTHRSAIDDGTKQLAAKLAEKLERGDTAKLVGQPGESQLIHTKDPERVLKILRELGVDCENAHVEEPSRGYKRSTISF